MNINPFGVLYLVATPLGNKSDISFRAIEILKTVNLIAAEDTRHSAPLLQQYAISTPLFSLHEHNEREKTEKIIEKLLQGQSIALISDAGTPLISDPGYFLVREARLAGIKVVPIPGACAAIAALSASGLPTDRFIFEGFLPAKSKARRDRLSMLRFESRTMIFYEAPHRILDFLQDIENSLGPERNVVIARELTKVYETIHSAPVNEMIRWVQEDANQQKGEMVVLVAGSDEVQEENQVVANELLLLLMQDLPLKKAAEITAKVTGKRKNELYQLGLSLQNKM